MTRGLSAQPGPRPPGRPPRRRKRWAARAGRFRGVWLEPQPRLPPGGPAESAPPAPPAQPVSSSANPSAWSSTANRSRRGAYAKGSVTGETHQVLPGAHRPGRGAGAAGGEGPASALQAPIRAGPSRGARARCSRAPRAPGPPGGKTKGPPPASPEAEGHRSGFQGRQGPLPRGFLSPDGAWGADGQTLTLHPKCPHSRGVRPASRWLPAAEAPHRQEGVTLPQAVPGRAGGALGSPVHPSVRPCHTHAVPTLTPCQPPSLRSSADSPLPSCHSVSSPPLSSRRLFRHLFRGKGK